MEKARSDIHGSYYCRAVNIIFKCVLLKVYSIELFINKIGNH